MTNGKKDGSWESAPLLREEGVFHGTVLKTSKIRNAAGMHLFVRMAEKDSSARQGPSEIDEDNAEQELLAQKLLPVFQVAVPDIPSTAEEALSKTIHLLEEMRKTACPADAVRIPVFFSDWKYAEECNDSDEMDIVAMLHQVRPGHSITFRMSKNWRKKAFYCRYLRDETLGIWSGNQSESDWRQALHPYPPFDRAGTFALTILHCGFVTDDFNRGSFSLEVLEKNTAGPGRYRMTAPQGTQAFRFLQGLPETEICNHVFSIHTEPDPETGRSFADHIVPASRRRKSPARGNNSARKARSAGFPQGYAAMKAYAAHYEPLPVTELDTQQTFYKVLTGVVYDDNYTDFLVPGFCFLPVLLDDGRIISPELRSRTKKSRDALRIVSCLGLKNQLKERRSLLPGVRVTLYFTPAQHKRYLMLRALTIDTDGTEVEILRMEYLRKVLIRNKLLPETENTVKIWRMDEEERKKYQEMLEERRILL